MFTLCHLYYIYCSYLPEPHEKISVCVCADTPLFFWINSEPAFHGVGQVPVPLAMAPGVLKHDSFADLSGVKMFAEKDLKRARPFGVISNELRQLLLGALAAGNRMLPEARRQMAAEALTVPAANSPSNPGSQEPPSQQQ